MTSALIIILILRKILSIIFSIRFKVFSIRFSLEFLASKLFYPYFYATDLSVYFRYQKLGTKYVFVMKQEIVSQHSRTGQYFGKSKVHVTLAFLEGSGKN